MTFQPFDDRNTLLLTVLLFVAFVLTQLTPEQATVAASLMPAIEAAVRGRRV